MRVLRILFTGLLVILLLAGGSFFVARETLLWWASGSIADSLDELARTKTKGTFAQQCQSLVGSDVFQALTPEYQLRFLSNSEYALEVVCSESVKKPILISRKKLPIFITKVPGSSGILPSALLSGIRLTAFAEELQFVQGFIGKVPDWLQSERAIVLSQGSILADKNPMELGVGPLTSCEGYGFVCCDEQTQMGAGESLSGAQNCPNSCFSSCISRPVLLSFTTAPLLNPQTRRVTIAAGSSISFYYAADSGASDKLQATLVFGDGTQAQLQGSTGSSEHVYTCSSGNCQYTAQIELSDNWGVSAKSGKLKTVAVTVVSGV